MSDAAGAAKLKDCVPQDPLAARAGIVLVSLTVPSILKVIAD